jgi:transposase
MEKEKKKFVIGIDVSKKTFDIAVAPNEARSSALKACFSNSLSGYDKCSAWLDDFGVNYFESLICLENTGIYHRLLVEFLLSKKAFVWVETPVQIKWSMGIQRGKSDTVDCERIMQYAYRNQDKAVPHQVMNSKLQQIADYMALRSRFQQCIKSLKVPIKELKSVGLVEQYKAIEKASKKSLTTLEKELKAIDKKIQLLIEQDNELAPLYALATSVRCVGFVAATYMLIYTNGFTRFDSSKQFAAYCGIAPFEYSSGTSIRGKTKVHPMANKTMKAILHMCALSSVRHNPEMKAYFARKVGEGKNKMLVLNAVRNKIVGRVFSCVKNQRMYEQDYAA